MYSQEGFDAIKIHLRRWPDMSLQGVKNSDVLALLSEASCEALTRLAQSNTSILLFQVGELSSLLSDAVIASSGGSHVDSLMSDAAGPWSASWEAADPPFARIVDTSEGTL